MKITVDGYSVTIIPDPDQMPILTAFVDDIPAIVCQGSDADDIRNKISSALKSYDRYIQRQ